MSESPLLTRDERGTAAWGYSAAMVAKLIWLPATSASQRPAFWLVAAAGGL